MQKFLDLYQAHILVAARLEQRSTVIKLLGDRFNLSFVSTMKEVETILRGDLTFSFGLVICSIDFDESRMFEMFQFLQNTVRLKSVPFVAINDRRPVTQATASGIAAVKLMGSGFVQLSSSGCNSDQEERALLDTVLVSLMRKTDHQRSSQGG